MPKTVRLTARSFVYNGKSQKPGVTVIASNGKALSPNSYTVTYSENTVSVGRHDIKVTLKGRYSGVLNACYVINPKKNYIDSATALSKGIRLQIRQQPKKMQRDISFSIPWNLIFPMQKLQMFHLLHFALPD